MRVFHIPRPAAQPERGRGGGQVEGQDLHSAIDELDARFAGFKGRLLDEMGEPRQIVNFFVNDKDVRLGHGLDSRLSQDDEIAIVPGAAPS